MASVSLDFVPYPEQVQRLMKSALAEGQRARRHTLVLPPEFWPFAYPGAILAWTSPRNGYVNKLFRVDGVVDRANLDIMIDVTEVDPSDYNWNPATDYRPPVDGAVGVIRPPVQPLVGWQVFPATIGPPGKELPSIRVAFPGKLVDVRAVRVRVRLAGETAFMFDGEVPYGDPNTNDAQESVILSGTFSPDTDYQVQGILVPYGERETSWSVWLDVKTPNVWINDVYPIDLDRLAEDVTGVLEWAGGGLREIERRFEEIELWISDQDFGNAFDRQKIREQVTATYEHAQAQWTYEVEVLAAADLALATRVETLNATVGSNYAEFQSTAAALASTDTALANSITALNVEVFNPVTGLPAVASAVSALEAYSGPDGTLANAVTSLSASSTPGEISEANFRMQAVSGPVGYTTIAAQTRQNGGGAWRGAAWYLRTPNDENLPTEFVVDAQQMVFGDVSSGSYINPLVYSGGVWRMNVANIGTVTAGVIRSPDSRFVINLATGSIEWFD